MSAFVLTSGVTRPKTRQSAGLMRNVWLASFAALLKFVFDPGRRGYRNEPIGRVQSSRRTGEWSWGDWIGLGLRFCRWVCAIAAIAVIVAIAATRVGRLEPKVWWRWNVCWIMFFVARFEFSSIWFWKFDTNGFENRIYWDLSGFISWRRIKVKSQWKRFEESVWASPERAVIALDSVACFRLEAAELLFTGSLIIERVVTWLLLLDCYV